MRTVSYDIILRGVCDAMSWDPDNLDAREWHAAKRAISNALATAWKASWWTDLMRVGLRRYRNVWSATAGYTSQTELWHEASRAYYVAIRDTVAGQAPATYAAGEWTTNTAYWAELERSYGDTDQWDATASYAVGDQVRYAEDGRTYQCHTTASPGDLPTDTTKWGRVPEFDSYVPFLQTGKKPIGTVRQVTLRNPRVYQGPGRLNWYRSERGIEINEPTQLLEVWVEHRLRHPRLEGDVWDATVAYEAASPEDIPDTSGLDASSTMVTADSTSISGDDA
jgi:hypothetical protein